MKNLTVLSVLLLIFHFSSAQHLYTKIGGGYAFGTGGQNLLFENSLDYFDVKDMVNITNNSDGSTTWENVYVSLGKGSNINGSIGYKINRNFEIEIAGNYHFSYKYKSVIISRFDEETTELTSRMISIIPAFSISPGFEKINPYAKLGFVIGKGYINDYLFVSSDNIEVLTQNVKLNGGISKGMQYTVGTELPLNKTFLIYAEFVGINMTYAPKTAELNEYTINGEDQLPYFPENLRKIDLDDTYTEEAGTPPPGATVKRLKVVFPYSSLGINAGIKLVF
jgi:hypothetical protein